VDAFGPMREVVAEKIQLKRGERLLDIGCGWGTLVAHMAEHHGADATGVTLAARQAEFGTDRIQKKGLTDKARILTMDYRQIPKERWNKITVLEMAESIHKDFAHQLKFARIWGSGKFDGQRVQRDYVVQENDIIEIHI